MAVKIKTFQKAQSCIYTYKVIYKCAYIKNDADELYSHQSKEIFNWQQ